MDKVFFVLFIISFSICEEFKSNREINIEKNLIAPCCSGGSIHGHDDNTYTMGIKALVHELVKNNIDKKKIMKIYYNLYGPQSGISESDLPPIISDSTIKDTFNRIHSNMSDREILNLFAKIHGNQILSSPPSNIYGVWLIPLIFFIIGLGFVFSLTKSKIIK